MSAQNPLADFLTAIGNIAKEQGERYYAVDFKVSRYDGYLGMESTRFEYSGYINPMVRFEGETPEEVIEKFKQHYSSRRALSAAEGFEG